MCQSDTSSWQKNGKTYNGLRDFGLLRDKPDPLDRKPAKLFSIYFSRTVFVVGILAGFTLVVCLILADKYQKTSKTPHLHHYASSYIYEKEREKLLLDKNRRQETRRRGGGGDDNNLVALIQKIQNISKNIRVDEINRLMPITTVLHTVNVTAPETTAAGYGDNDVDTEDVLRSDRVGKIDEKRTTTPVDANETRKYDRVIRSKKIGPSLADLLKRTEAKSAANVDESSTAVVTETTGVQFAQLEGYGHYFREKKNEVIDLMKFVDCQTATKCGQKFSGEEPTVTDADESIEITDWQRDDELDTDRDYSVRFQNVSPRDTFPTNNDSIPVETAAQPTPHDNDMLYADTNIPVYYSPYFSGKHRTNAADPFRNFRVSDPMEINDLEQPSNAVPQPSAHTGIRRFSNRLYQSDEAYHEPRLYTGALEPYLRPPPTPSPVGLSFTPSYTTAILHGYGVEDASATAPHQQSDEPKPEETVLQPLMRVKPISLMVEIFPANDYQLPGSVFGENQRQQPQPRRQPDGNSLDPTQQVGNPSWLPWTLSSASSQNRMRLHVNLFPQPSEVEHASGVNSNRGSTNELRTPF